MTCLGVPKSLTERPADRLRGSRWATNFLVVDEAHLIDRWDYDVRPDYGRLAGVREAVGRPPILAFTASAGVESQKRILESLDIPDAEVIVLGVDRPNIGLVRLPVERDDRLEEGSAYLDEAVNLDPNLAIAWAWRAGARTALGHAELAIKDLERALHVSPLDPLIFVAQGQMAKAHFLCQPHRRRQGA